MSRPLHRAGFRAALLGLLAFLALAVAAPAAEDDQVIFPAGTSGAAPASVPGTTSLNTVTLIVGLVLAGVGGWLVWRQRRGVPAGRDLRSLAIAETRSLGNRQYLVVASYEGKKFLLGVCPGRINLLSALPSEDDDEDDFA